MSKVKKQPKKLPKLPKSPGATKKGRKKKNNGQHGVAERQAWEDEIGVETGVDESPSPE